MRMKLFAVAALAAIPAAAFAQTYLVYPNGTTAQVIDSRSPAAIGNPVVVNTPVVAGTPVTAAGQPVTYSGDPVVYSSAPMAVYPSSQIAYVATPVLIQGTSVTQKSGDSGPGTVDKTHPGTENGIGPSSRDAGTSSAGSS